MVMIQKIKENKGLTNAFWLIGGSFLNKVIAFLVGIFTARLLGPNDYGLINYGTAYVGFFAFLCTLGLGDILVNQLIVKSDQEGTTLGTALLLRIMAGIASVLLATGIVSIVDAGETKTIQVVFFCSLSMIFQAFDTLIYWFQSKLLSKYSSLILFISYIIMAVYKIILLIFKQDVLYFALATSLEYIVMACLLFWVYQRNDGPRLKFSKSCAKELLQLSSSFILSGMMVAVYANTDKLMLKQMMSEAAVGHYSLAANISSLWAFAMTAIISAFSPLISQMHQKDYERFRLRNKQLYAIIFYISVTLSLLICIVAEPLITLLYGSEYLPAVRPLRIIIWYTAFSYLGGARSLWLVCEKKQRYMTYIYILSAILNVMLNFILIPRWGAEGAAWASLFTQISTIAVWPVLIPELRPNVKLMVEGILLRDILPNRKKRGQ